VCTKHAIEGQGISKFLVGCPKVKCTSKVKNSIASRINQSKRLNKEMKELHKIFYSYCGLFPKNPAKNLKGYAAMEAVKKWATKHPTVRMVRVDDSFHANSDLIFIPHETKRKYMGTTVVFIPQCTGEEPIEFFLYPKAVTKLQEVLKYIDRKKGKSKY
jgi:hypothetical protein